MVWIKKRKGNWLPAAHGEERGAQSEKRKEIEKAYSLAEVAAILHVDKRTLFKWMMYDDDPEEAVIPPSEWFKLPNGHIRIRERIVLKLLNPE